MKPTIKNFLIAALIAISFGTGTMHAMKPTRWDAQSPAAYSAMIRFMNDEYALVSIQQERSRPASANSEPYYPYRSQSAPPAPLFGPAQGNLTAIPNFSLGSPADKTSASSAEDRTNSAPINHASFYSIAANASTTKAKAASPRNIPVALESIEQEDLFELQSPRNKPKPSTFASIATAAPRRTITPEMFTFSAEHIRLSNKGINPLEGSVNCETTQRSATPAPEADLSFRFAQCNIITNDGLSPRERATNHRHNMMTYKPKKTIKFNSPLEKS